MPWITTKSGKRINTDWFDEDAEKKEKQIKANQDQANSMTKEKRIEELEKKLADAKGFFARNDIKQEIEMIKADFKGTLKEWKEKKAAEFKASEEKKAEEYQKKKAEEAEKKKQKEESAKKQLEEELKTQPKEKVEKFKIIQEHNPMNDEYHVGIRKPSDIKTWKEVLESKDDDSFSWGDFSRKDAEKALKSGTITIYSSYPIKQGTFVSTSKKQAEDYAGGEGKKIYTKTIPISEVAWINGDEGQYAKI